MQITPVTLPKLSPLMTDYRQHADSIMAYFDYKPFTEFELRAKELQARDFNRVELTNVLRKMNDRWQAPEATMNNIERLKEQGSLTVVGGQQAGLLTGPLYSVNKVISIIKLAEDQEHALGLPVIPVFWIAGEDHDYEEINHSYVLEAAGMVQYRTGQRVHEKSSITDIEINKDETKIWLEKTFTELVETGHTRNLYEVVMSCLNESNTYVDFFARLIYHIFEESGIVLLDSGDSILRRIEGDFFKQLIDKQSEISEFVYKDYQRISQDGYSIMLNVEEHDTHLFYKKDNERILLVRDSEGYWVGKNNEVRLTTSEMLSIANDTPELLSNNVVTRPLMQELLLPTLAFVGGNGEISYWAVLKRAFNALNLKMPPVVPRLSITYVDSSIQKIMNKFNISIEDVLNNQLGQKKGHWLEAQYYPPINLMTEQLRTTIEQAHLPLRQAAGKIRSDLGDVSERNLEHLLREVTYLEGSIMKALQDKHQQELASFDLVDQTLNPFGGLQERIWNPLPFLNAYGSDFFMDLTTLSYDFTKEHILIQI